MRITIFQKFHPKAKLRAWSQARTFGGTSKPKSLYICGFRRRNFFLLCAGIVFIAVVVAAGGGFALTRTLANGRKVKEELNKAPVVTTVLSTEVVLSTDAGGVVFTTFQTRSIVETRARNPPRPTVSTGADGSVTTITPSPTTTGGTATNTGTPGTTNTGTTSTNTGVPTTTGTTASTTSGASSSSSAASTSTSAAEPPPDGDFFTGEGTFYAPGLGSCGITSTDADFICALAKDLFDPDTPNGNSNNNPNCNRKIFVQLAGGKRKRDDNAQYFTKVIIRRHATPMKFMKVHRRGILGREDPEPEPPAPLITPAPRPDSENLNRLERRAGVTITVVDRCPVCAKYDLDLSPAAYSAIGANVDDGRVEIEWKWVD